MSPGIISSNRKSNPTPVPICSEERTLDFSGTIRNLLTLESDNDRIDRLVAAFPDHFVNYGLNLTKTCIEKIRGSGVGFYSYLHDRLYAGAASPRILPMETLRADLHSVPLGLSPSETMLTRQFILSVPNLNVSDHKPHHDYYSPELKALVGTMDGSLMDRYGYVF